jgi:predicted enzyme related to lactoylglutathione lyase
MASMRNATRNPVVHFEVLGRDAGALKKFYGEAFGWPVSPTDEGPMEYSMVHFGDGGRIDGGIGKAPEGPGHVTFYIGVDDPQATLDAVGRLGGRTIQSPVAVPGGVTFALFADPEGHVVGLVKE